MGRRITEYSVCALDRDHPGYEHCQIQVTETGWRVNGMDYWAVRHWPDGVINAQGEWDREHRPSDRSPNWLLAHRFPLDVALELADRAAQELADKWQAKWGDE